MTSDASLLKFSLRLADNLFVLSHRLSELTSSNPTLEEDIAVANISLDLLGQARHVYSYCGETLENKNKSEDDYAYLRDEREFYNVKLVEQPNTDFAYVMARQLFFDTFQILFYESLIKSPNKDLSSIAEKGLKEIKYHYRHSSNWVIRLGDGTEESHQRMQEAVDELFTYTGELFSTDEVEVDLIKQGVIEDPNSFKSLWEKRVQEVLKEATIKTPSKETFMAFGGKNGVHTEYLGKILAEMQCLHRAFPGAEW